MHQRSGYALMVNSGERIEKFLVCRLENGDFELGGRIFATVFEARNLRQDEAREGGIAGRDPQVEETRRNGTPKAAALTEPQFLSTPSCLCACVS
uniref:Uncharacterized protein n=1 Tax=Parascaris equorum TaxID=6256 RepID=A0A914R5E5_PAREQ